MLSTIVLSRSAAADRPFAAGPLLRTLATLVPATVEGVVRDVALLGTADELVAIADEAGCRLLEGRDFGAGLAEGVAAARAPWLFVVRAGAMPSRLFGEEVAQALAGETHGSWLLRAVAEGGIARLVPALARPAGVIVARSRLLGARCAGFADVLRLARPARPLPSGAVFRDG